MTGLEQFVRDRMQRSVKEPWPAGNLQFVASLDGIIRHRGCKEFLRNRLQGTTTLMHAAATYAAGEGLCPYVLLIGPCSNYARWWSESLESLCQHVGYGGRRKGRRLVFDSGACIEVAGVLGSVRGLSWMYQGQRVRPSLVLMDLGTLPRTVGRCRRVLQAVDDIAVGGITPAGVAICTSVE